MSKKSNANIVQNLFLPSFTNAGSSETYQYKYNQQHQDEHQRQITTTRNNTIMDGKAETGSHELHHHEEQYDGSEIGGYAPKAQEVVSQEAKEGKKEENSNDLVSEDCEDHDKESTAGIDLNYSMAVNTGIQQSDLVDYCVDPSDGGVEVKAEIESEAGFDTGTGGTDAYDGMQTPQKNLLSPPPVTRRRPVPSSGMGIETNAELSYQTKLFRESGSGPSKKKIDVPSQALRFRPGEERRELDRGMKLDSKSIDAKKKEALEAYDEEETSSLVSEYGSDVGEVKLRLEDVKRMDVLAEEEGDTDTDTEKSDDAKSGEISVEIQPEKTANPFKDDCRLSYDEDRRDKNLVVEVDVEVHDDEDRHEDYLSHADSVHSVDLASQHDGLKFDSSDYQKDEVRPSSPALKPRNKKESDFEPTTPIGAVSAVLRRFGNGVSNMTRCTMSPRHDENFEEGYSLKHREVGDVWLSPRFGGQKNTVPKIDIQQPNFSDSSAPVWKKSGARGAGNASMRGITSCLSFDPVSGRRPYGNMRMTDSPPSSPLHPPRKTKSWGNGGESSDLFVDSVKELYEGNRIKVLSESKEIKSSQMPGSRIFSGQSAAAHGSSSFGGFRPGTGMRPLGAILSPRRDKAGDVSAISPPRGNIRFADEHLSPKPSKRPIMMLQSPQRVGDIEREDALDLLALLVERSLAFQESMENSADTHGQAEEKITKNDRPNIGSNDLNGCIEAIREISEASTASEEKFTHEDRITALDALVNAHTYAMEMKQAALSASTWLNAIGRNGKTRSENTMFDSHKSQLISEERLLRMESSELLALLQATQLELIEKNHRSKQLDHELSICRAEIGRLKTISRNETSFLSPDKSILDEDDEDDDSSCSSANSSKNEFPERSAINIDMNVTHHSDHCSDSQNNNHTDTNSACMIEAKREIILLKAELEEANRMLKSMEKDIKWPNAKDGKMNGRPDNKVEDKHEGRSIECNDEISKHIQDKSARKTQIEEERKNQEDQSSGKSSALPKDSGANGIEDATVKEAAINDLAEPNVNSAAAEIQTGSDQSTSLLMDTLKEELDDYVSAIQNADKEEISMLKRKIESLEKTKSGTQDPTEKMINVRMLNAENFVTGWDKMGSLPPPPDHDLRSPIVSDLLSQWTTDTVTRESLLSWVENILDGQECSAIPPLQLSGLDHQLREGFTMHILPFLLRRSDIHVEVTTRAHRKTSYDVSVSIKSAQASQDGSLSFGDQKQQNALGNSGMNLTSRSPHMMAFKASSTAVSLDQSGDSPPPSVEKIGRFRGFVASALETGSDAVSVSHSAVTTPASNHTINPSQLNRLVKGDNKTFAVSSEDGCNFNSSDRAPTQQQGGIMAGALNAMGGLLSRRRTPSSKEIPISKKMHTTPPSPTYRPGEIEDTTSDLQEENQPYHRVVSAPPGRIGMTFVSYRGHAMISDVSKDSPLAGWVFPSDILIAIDEVPVSGMRVPDIVKLLTARKERQRALRVISSHAMTELVITESSAALMDG